MSATGRGGERAAHDFYGTPAWTVHRYLEARGERGCGLRWLEPSAGTGAIIRAANSVRPGIQWTPVEPFPLDPAALGQFVRADFLSCSWSGRPFDLAIGNPPYSLAQEFIEHALKFSHEVAYLLRLNFLEGAKRQPFLRANPCDVFVLPNRPSFTPDGHTDATAYAWFEFGGKDRGRLQVLDLTPKAERART